MLQDEINQKEKGCLQVAARSASRTFCSAKPAGGLRHMHFPRALTGFPVSSTAKVMYCRMLDAMLSNGQEDENGILFICFPVTAIAAVLSRSPMTVKRSLNELETAGLIMRVRQGVGEPNRIYVLIPGKEDAALA